MIVMKFGGTSVQDAQAIDRVAAIVRERLPERPVVVISALAKITDQLLAMAAAAGAILEPDSESAADSPPDWTALEGAAAARARAEGSDPARLAPNWSGSTAGAGTAEEGRR